MKTYDEKVTALTARLEKAKEAEKIAVREAFRTSSQTAWFKHSLKAKQVRNLEDQLANLVKP